MKFRNHIGYRFLTDPEFYMMGLQKRMPEAYSKFEKGIPFTEEEDKNFNALAHLLIMDNSRNFFVTETVFDKLDLLKVKRDENGFDWTVFKSIPHIKHTYLYPGFRDPATNKQYQSGLVRVMTGKDGWLGIVHIGFKFKPGETNAGVATYNYMFCNRNTGFESDEMGKDAEHIEIAQFIYKMLCFIFLSDNEEIILQPGRSNGGTKKSGKILNDLPVPITIINSKWNITSIRTEGFAVSGHFHIYHTGPGRTIPKLLWVDPFEKKGYTRRAQNETVKL